MLPAIQGLWIGEELSVMEQLSITSFLKNGHPYHLYVYGGVRGVPEGAVLKDANDVIDSGKIFKYRQHDSYAGFANLFRYKLLLEKGGYWVDSDVVCLKPFRFESDHVFVKEHVKRNQLDRIRKRYSVTNWVIKAPKGSKIMNFCYRVSAERDPNTLSWGETGPRLFRSAVAELEMEEFALLQEYLFPIGAEQWKQFINGSFLADRKWNASANRAYAMHLYNEMWRRGGRDKNDTFPENSIYERLKRLYLDACLG